MVAADLKITDARPDDYVALVIPGGQIDPDLLRVDVDAMRIGSRLPRQRQSGGGDPPRPWPPVEVDALKGQQATSYKSIRKDLENAGARWVNREGVTDPRHRHQPLARRPRGLRGRDHRGNPGRTASARRLNPEPSAVHKKGSPRGLPFHCRTAFRR